MVVISVRGVTYNDIRNKTSEELKTITAVQLVAEPWNQADSRAIAVYAHDGKQMLLKLGYVAGTDLLRAHRESWTSWSWQIHAIGRFQPSFADTSCVFCKLCSTKRAKLA
jgi:hypothetical protein